MLKTILNVKGASVIEKQQQKGINGGLLQINQECTLQTQGQRCGPPHCPGLCGRRAGQAYCWPF